MSRRKLRVISIFILFTFLTLLCGTKSYAKDVPSSSTEQTDESSLEDSAEADISNDDSQINWSSYLLYLSLGLNALVLILVIIHLKSNISENRVEDIAKKVYDRRSQTSIESNQLDARCIENMVDRLVDSKVSAIVSDKIKQIESSSECRNTTQTENASIGNVVSKPYLYATAANRDNNTFYDVIAMPKRGSTIYALRVDGNRAEFGVFKDAYEKVIKDKNFLECACQIVGNGQSVRTEEPGIAEKQSNGKWKIIKKAIIKFE